MRQQWRQRQYSMIPLRMWFNDKVWYQTPLTWAALLLLPFSWLFGLIAAIRRCCYRWHLLPSYRVDRPLIVVGNITVGGSGKTPCVLALVRQLLAEGYRPGIVSRGAGGSKHRSPLIVLPETKAEIAGDEAVLMARLSQSPVVVCVDRVKAVQELLTKFPTCDVVISDDGLQHYRMQRDIEIVVVDGAREFGNEKLLPAGPLREPVSRLSTVDFIIVNGGQLPDAFTMTLEPSNWAAVQNAACTAELDMFTRKTVHAVAGIGNPARFFKTVSNLQAHVIPHAFADHYHFTQADLHFQDDLPIVMTAKDAVKCETFANEKMWYLQVFANIDHDFWRQLLKRLRELRQDKS